MKWNSYRLIIYGLLLFGLLLFPGLKFIDYYFIYLPTQKRIAIEVAISLAEREGYDWENTMIRCKKRDNLFVVRFSPKDPSTFGGSFEVGLDARSKAVMYHYGEF